MGSAPATAASTSSCALHLVLVGSRTPPHDAHCAGGGVRACGAAVRQRAAGVWILPVHPTHNAPCAGG
eukprot:4312270-Lingulodinium_polyedra.AAC.1